MGYWQITINLHICQPLDGNIGSNGINVLSTSFQIESEFLYYTAASYIYIKALP